MKKFFALLLSLAMVLALVACGQKDPTPDTPDTPDDPQTKVEYKVAMITDYGDITDQSFNQTTYEACKAFAEDNSIEFSYFRPAGDNTADRVAMIEKAVDEGFNVIVMPGYAFGGAIVEAAPEFPDVKFIALDVAAGDLLETAVAKAGETYDYTPENWDLNKYVDMSNVYCAVYQEELCGYMAGYAAVKLGYKNLGFLGGMAVPAVVRYGYGFVQGVDAAAADLGLTDVTVNYVYGGQFFGDADITAVMDTWYAGGTEIVFACGGGIYTSAVDAAKKVGGKVIGVIPDVKLIQERRHPGLTECIETKDMAERKQKMIELADAYVALPGGPGTLDEISEVICLARLGIENKACVLFDTDGYYQALKKIFEEMVEVGFSEKEDFKRVLVSADLDEVGRFIEQ